MPTKLDELPDSNLLEVGTYRGKVLNIRDEDGPTAKYLACEYIIVDGVAKGRHFFDNREVFLLNKDIIPWLKIIAAF